MLEAEEKAELAIELELENKTDELGAAEEEETPVLKGIELEAAELAMEETPVLRGTEGDTEEAAELAIELEFEKRTDELGATDDEAGAVLRGTDETGAAEDTPVLRGTEGEMLEAAELAMELELLYRADELGTTDDEAGAVLNGIDETGAEEETPVLRGTEALEKTEELATVELGNRPDELAMTDDDAAVLRGMDEEGAKEETPVLRGTELYTDELAMVLELGNRPDELAMTDDEAAVLRGIDDTGTDEEPPVLRGTELYTDELATVELG
jgi:hypothetical protein